MTSAGPITSCLGLAALRKVKETKAFLPGVTKRRMCGFATGGTCLPWQHGGDPPRAGEEEMDTRREAEGGLLARSEALDLAVQGA